MREEFDGVLKELRWRGPPLPLIEPTKLFEYNIRLIGAALSRLPTHFLMSLMYKADGSSWHRGSARGVHCLAAARAADRGGDGGGRADRLRRAVG